ncbi:hypothetical protein [Marinospirillum alkaliphilum]|uniref:Uncharacterized protein n=1 Tax=Marinospirillum alkaliphilum DSM 21637 TaxID=1122209 RepID=A0A1K1XPY8_9GAMM|nr:hypothetical protein [Marinospirillum alkaliphilum]SFX51655.1 hypothetical protein SAMN02745752_01967 [Marinospirillum alkaliphilum DSM 21637]
MFHKTPFKYSECLTDKALSKLPERLKVSGSDPEILLILRLLSGALKVEHIGSSKTFFQKENYFSSSLKGYGHRWGELLPQLIAENYGPENLADYIEGHKLKNKTFYKNILSELSYYFYYQNKNIHSSSFVYLYRALEHVSYAFPMIYASKTDDFGRTFKFLKELMNGDKNAGELGFFKSFIKTVYSDDAIYESSVDFPMLLNTESEQKVVFNLLKDLCSGDMIADSTDSPRLLSIKYIEVGSFIITIRNRFFHYMNGGAKNIETSKINDIDNLFYVVNKKCLYWLATIFLAVISHSALEFESIKPRS